MNIFREKAEYGRQRNRNSRFGGWKGLLVKILLGAVIFTIVKGYTSVSFENIIWLFQKSQTITNAE